MTTQWHNILSGDAAAEALGRGDVLVLVFMITKDAPLTAAHSGPTQNQ